MDGLEQLNNNVDAYIRRTNFARAMAGTFVLTGVAGLLWIAFSLIEHFFRLDSVSRALLLLLFALSAIGLLVILILKPLLKAFGLMGRDPEGTVAREIGNRIPTVEDRLLNIFNLQRFSGSASLPLLKASLNQKAMELNRIDFGAIVDYKASLIWMRLTLAPVILFVVLSIWDSRIIGESSVRLIRFNESFVAPAPFQFQITNESLSIPEGDAFELQVGVNGRVEPEHVFVVLNDAEFRMKRDASGMFSHVFSNVRSDVEFSLRGASVESNTYTLKVLKRPKLIKTEAYYEYPAYTGLKNKSAVNEMQVSIPEGTRVRWKMDFKNADGLAAFINDMPVDNADDRTLITHRFTESGKVKISTNSAQGLSDTFHLGVNVVKDAFPQVTVEVRMDSTSGMLFFNGDLRDDYGLSALKFVVEHEGQVLMSSPIEVSDVMTEQGFAYVWNADTLLKKPGQAFAYYFEVWDNDAINGAKSAKSIVRTLRAPTQEELATANEQISNKSKASLESNNKALKELNQEAENLKRELLQKKKEDWNDKERMQELLDKQKGMMQELEQRAKDQRNQQNRMEKYNSYSEEVMRKQELIQKMFDELFDEEFKQKYEEYNRLLEEMDKREMLEKLDEMKLDNEMLEKQLDRTLELFKQLEVEKKVEDNIQRLNEMIEEQEDIKSDLENKKGNESDLKERQDNLSKEMDQVKDELKKLHELNQELEEPQDIPEMQQDANEAQDKMDQASEEMSKSNQKKASQQQQGAADKMQKMKEKLEQFQQQQQQDQHTENLEDMRQLLENIVSLSMEQERVMEALKPLRGSDPQYVQYAKRQKDILDDVSVVEDSLLALSKRVPEIDRLVNDEIAMVRDGMIRALGNLTDQQPNQEQRYKAMAAERQQYSMTALNNLALIFDEIIQQMQQQMSALMKGSGQCKKPGQGNGAKPSAADMKGMQESLNKQLQRLKEAMEKGEGPNGKKPGQTQGMGMGGMSKELAQMAAQQAELRRQLRQMSESLEKEGDEGGGGSRLKEIDKLMEQTEEDILFGKIDGETMRRQEKIMTKLLESEKAEREREFEDKRESRSAEGSFNLPDEVWEEFKKKREKEVELYKTLPPNLKPFYRNEVNRYFSTFD